jgi:hypothetical protein
MDFVLEIDQAARVARCTLMVLLPGYLSARYTQPEWVMAFRSDPDGALCCYSSARSRYGLSTLTFGRTFSLFTKRG